MDLKELLFSLSQKDGLAYITDTTDYVFDILNKYTNAQKVSGLGVVGFLKGEGDYTLMLDAHIDQIGMVVTNIDNEGFLTVSNAGGIDVRMLPSKQVTVHGKEKISAVFSSTPPHLMTDEIKYTDISDLKLDSMLGERAKDLISVGDIVTFSSSPMSLLDDRVVGRSFDNRASVTCLLKLAEELSKEKLPLNIAFSFSDSEELGVRGIRPLTYGVSPDEAIAVDVSFGNAPEISKEESGVLGGGAMIGVSPSLDKKISRSLINIAEENNIKYQIEVTGESTGTNADMISISKTGVKTGLISIPLRNMHTDAEVVDTKDMESVCAILKAYILSGGGING